ncbi:hypothetical protein [Fulvivirga lutimaris]|uniref:hypothetical protein n=1 Tax=Fulvivirga lutimaris TaxID=1819566 RepID=UPI0012BC0D1A|nr:hypothetical protein [Fulvivirga lutimaris]MTI39867.1 hypothetical protein [Fulvivirga lutimaris]
MKKLITPLLLILSMNLSYAQKYKDVFPQLLKASDTEALSIIKSYMIDDLDHPNSNLRLALIYEKRYKACNPITEFEKAIANASEAKLRFGKSAAVVTEKEVNKNTGYYSDFATGYDNKGRPIVEYNTVTTKIRTAYDSAAKFTEHMPIIYEYFTKSVNFHDNAIKAFNEINGQFGSRDKLLLMYDTDLKAKLQQMISDYDSSIIYLDKYLETGKSFDKDEFNQSYSIKKIDTYRLQGLLTSPSFLVDKIEIWDYKSWAQNAIDEASNEVASLRTELNMAELSINNSLKKLSPLALGPEYNPYKVDSKLIFSLVKYDNQSLPVASLKYKQFKQDLIHQLALVNDRDTSANDLYLVHLGELIYKSREADSLLLITKNRLTTENINKYPSYFRTHYNGEDGMNQFISAEQKLIKDAADKAVSEMKINIKKNEKVIGAEFVTYRNLKIPTKAKPINGDSVSTSIITTHTELSTDGSHYFVGLNKMNRKPGHTNVFVAKTDEKLKVKWYKEFSMTEDSATPNINDIGDIAITPEGCAILVRSKNEVGIKNALLYLNENGEEIFNKELDTSWFPRQMQYVESKNAFIFAHKGASFIQNYKEQQETNLTSINILGDILWSQTFNFTGNIVDLVNLGRGFLLVGNYAELKDTEGKTFRTRINTGQTNAFAARFANDGSLVAVTPVESNNNYYIDRVIKINDKIINLLGKKGSLEIPERDDVHIIINQSPEVLNVEL